MKSQIDQHIEGRELPNTRKVLYYGITITRQQVGYSDHAKFQFTDKQQYCVAMQMLTAAGVRPFSHGPVYEPIVIDFDAVSDIAVDGIDYKDSPDFCDAFIADCSYKGRPVTEDELEAINSNSDFVHEAVYNAIY